MMFLGFCLNTKTYVDKLNLIDFHTDYSLVGGMNGLNNMVLVILLPSVGKLLFSL